MARPTLPPRPSALRSLRQKRPSALPSLGVHRPCIRHPGPLLVAETPRRAAGAVEGAWNRVQDEEEVMTLGFIAAFIGIFVGLVAAVGLGLCLLTSDYGERVITLLMCLAVLAVLAWAAWLIAGTLISKG